MRGFAAAVKGKSPSGASSPYACDQTGIPNKAEDKVSIAFRLIEKAAEYGIDPARMHIDPLVLALSAVNDSALNFLKAVRQIKGRYPTVNVTAALSNISFGMPVRKLINLNFLSLSMEAGLDSVIADPTNRDLIATIYAVEALVGKDTYCRRFNNAFRGR